MILLMTGRNSELYLFAMNNSEKERKYGGRLNVHMWIFKKNLEMMKRKMWWIEDFINDSIRKYKCF